MGSDSPSARRHRALVFLARLVQYKTYGPLIGPKEAHQPNPRWEKVCLLCEGSGWVEDETVCGDPDHCSPWRMCPNGCVGPEMEAL